mgnify:FL=1
MQIKNKIELVKSINFAEIPKNTINYYWLTLITDGLGNPINIPVMVAKGEKDGPILGLTAALHGNELNGISVIQRLFRELDINDLSGTVVGIPVVNIPSFIRKKRRFNDGVDLNHIMPGKKDGNVSNVYAYRFVNKIINLHLKL